MDPSARSGVGYLFQLKTIHDLRAYVHSLGAWGPIASITLMVLHSVTFVPAEVVTIGNVVIFGPVLGVVYSWTGAMLGGYLSFFLARAFGRPLVERFVSKRLLERFDTFIERKGANRVFILRLIPLVSFNALNYVSGLTKMTFWDFTWTTGLGILPMEIVIAVVYQSAIGEKFAFVGLTVVGAAWLAGLVLRSKLQMKYPFSKGDD